MATLVVSGLLHVITLGALVGAATVGGLGAFYLVAVDVAATMLSRAAPASAVPSRRAPLDQGGRIPALGLARRVGRRGKVR